MARTQTPTQHTEASTLRAAILETATRLFIVHGYHGVGMRDISRESGASKALLYYHFQNKSDLFFAVLVEHLESAAELVKGSAGCRPNRPRADQVLLTGCPALAARKTCPDLSCQTRSQTPRPRCSPAFSGGIPRAFSRAGRSHPAAGHGARRIDPNGPIPGRTHAVEYVPAHPAQRKRRPTNRA